MTGVNESEFPFRAGHVVSGRYRIVRVLNAGGIGVVYEAEHTFNGLRVALKALYNRARDHAARMHGEARTLAELRHPNVVQITDGGVTVGSEDGGEGIVWFTMELLEGATLRQELARRGMVPIERALRFGIQICRGVAQAHARGVLHRDIKPENIFVVDPGDTIKVLDFGISKLNEATRRSSGLKTTDRFRILGTEAYLAPEALRADKMGPPADIYSTGHVLYEMIAGIHCWSEGPGPLDFPPKHELGTRQIFAPPIPLAERAAHTPDFVDRVVMQALEKNPAARPQTMNELATALEQALESFIKYRPPEPARTSNVVRDNPKQTVRLETKTEEIPAMDFDVRASGPVAISSSNSRAALDNALICGAARFVSSTSSLSPVERGMRVLAEVEGRIAEYRGMLRMLAQTAPGAEDRVRTALVNELAACGAIDSASRVRAIQALAKRLLAAGFVPSETSDIRAPVLAMGAGYLVNPSDRLDSAESALLRLVEREEDVQNFACTILVGLARTAPESHPAPRGALLALLLGSAEDSELARSELADFVLRAAPASQLEEVDELSVAQLRTSAAELRAQRPAPARPVPQVNAGMTPTPASMTTPAEPIAGRHASAGGGNLRGLAMTFGIAAAAAVIVGVVALAFRNDPAPAASGTTPAPSALVPPPVVSTEVSAQTAAAPAKVEPVLPTASAAAVPAPMPAARVEPRKTTSAATSATVKPAKPKSALPGSGLDDPGPNPKKASGVAF